MRNNYTHICTYTHIQYTLQEVSSDTSTLKLHPTFSYINSNEEGDSLCAYSSTKHVIRANSSRSHRTELISPVLEVYNETVL